MHELSIVKDVFDTLEEHYSSNLENIDKIQITAGLLSNVQPVLIQNAFDAFITENKAFGHMELEVIVKEIVAHCNSCDKDFPVLYHRFVCPCGQPSTTIVQGNELYISKVIFRN